MSPKETMSQRNDQAPQGCQLCGLPLPDQNIMLEIEHRRLYFCCEGCRGIYQMIGGKPESTNP